MQYSSVSLSPSQLQMSLAWSYQISHEPLQFCLLLWNFATYCLSYNLTAKPDPGTISKTWEITLMQNFSLSVRGWIMKIRFPLSNYLALPTSFTSMLYKHIHYITFLILLILYSLYFWYYFLCKKNSWHMLCKQEPYPNTHLSLIRSTC